MKDNKQENTPQQEAPAGAPAIEAPPSSTAELQIGSLEVRLAQSSAEVDAAQALRYRVFYEEMGANATSTMTSRKRDFDQLDDYCDHLLVVDRGRGEDPLQSVIATYRLIRRQAAATFGKFYSSDEFDIQTLIDYPGEILELGRSCVDASFRTRPTMQLMWRGIAAYVFQRDIQVMFGCASLPGTDISELRLPLSYLYYHHLAPPALRPVALPGRAHDMRLMDEHDINPKAGLNSLPPLLKGYLRLGGFIGDGAVIDHQFNTTDVAIVVKTDSITDKYSRHYDLKSKM